MSFSIQRMTLKDEAALRASSVWQVLARYTPRELSPTSEMTSHWLIDDEHDARFLRLRNRDVRENDFNYALIIGGDVVVLSVPEGVRPRVSLLYLPDALLPKLDWIQLLVLEAFQVGGRYCRGVIEDVIDSVVPRF